MLITRQIVAAKIEDHLHHRITAAELVDWAENAMRDGEFAEGDMDALRAVVSQLGLADVRAYGLLWEDCEHFLRQLGFAAQVNVVPV